MKLDDPILEGPEMGWMDSQLELLACAGPAEQAVGTRKCP